MAGFEFMGVDPENITAIIDLPQVDLGSGKTIGQRCRVDVDGKGGFLVRETARQVHDLIGTKAVGSVSG